MDAEFLFDPEDDRLEEMNDDLPMEFLVSNSTADDQSSKKIEVNAEYIDYEKLQSEYQNPALSYRLLHMLDVCANRRPEIANVINRVHSQGSIDVEFYRRFATDLEKYKAADPSKAWPTVDTQWITSTEEEVQNMLEKESTNLKKAQDEGIKENIRISMVKVFDINFRSGKFYEAAKLYARSLRDYCNTPRTVVPMLINHVTVLMYMKDYHRVETYANQAERAIADCQERESKHDRNNASMFPRDEKASRAALQQASKDMAKITAILGVTKMCNKNYATAADKFISVDHEVFEYQDLLSTTDIAYFGCFCALASYDRNQLKEKVINNANFRKFMEPEGKLVDLIHAFRNNSFITVFQLLEEMRPFLLLNIYIAEHQKQLYKLIRRRAFVQYISTFGVISLPTMAEVFRCDTEEIIDELVDLIDNGIIDAHIDPIEEKLYRFDENIDKKNSMRLSRIQTDLEERTRIIVVRSALAINGINPHKEYESEIEASGSGFPGMRAGRRRMAPFERYEDDMEDDDVEMVQQTQQLSFNNRGNMLGRLLNRFTKQQQPPQNIPHNLGLGNAALDPNDGNISDEDMSDPFN